MCVRVLVSVCVHQCAFQEGGSAGGFTQEANTVYISIMNQVAERQKEREREGCREEGMEKAIFPLLFSPLLPTNPCGAYSLYSAFAFFLVHHYRFISDQTAAYAISTTLTASSQALEAGLDTPLKTL